MIPEDTSETNQSNSRIPYNIVKAVAIDLETGEETELSVWPGSRCHFFPRFQYKEYEIQLRIDWGDLDENKDPTLDADFFKKGSDRPIKEMRRHPAHHTEKSYDKDSGLWIYKFVFEELNMMILLELTKKFDITGNSLGVMGDAKE